jgi:hypothetical protein
VHSSRTCECTIAREFWGQIRLGTGVKLPSLNTATDLITGACPKRDLAVILCGMWSLWMRRNSRRHGEQLLSMQQAVLWVRDSAHDLWKLTHPTPGKAWRPEVQHWRKPEPGWIKVNSDAAFRVCRFQWRNSLHHLKRAGPVQSGAGTVVWQSYGRLYEGGSGLSWWSTARCAAWRAESSAGDRLSGADQFMAKKGMSNDLLLDRSWRRSMLLVLPFIVFLFLMSIDLVIR